MQGVPTGPWGAICRTFKLGAAGKLAQWATLLPKINALEEDLKVLSDGAMRKASLSLRYRARSGEPLKDLLVEAFALVREAGRRKKGMRHYDVQILGGICIANRTIVEMQTGEGKTLTATAPLYLYALAGKGVQLATVNDYLAKRDADLMEPIYELLGMKVGVIQTQQQTNERRAAYAKDITYGTAKEFGFDFLRDRLLKRRISEGEMDLIGAMLGGPGQNNEQPVQRDAFFCLVDESDSILIDEARTPLIISAMPGEAEKIAVATYKWCAENALQFEEDVDYEYKQETKELDLTREGRRKARMLPKPPELDTVGMFDIYTKIEMAIKVQKEFIRDRQYVVRNGEKGEEIVIVDEFTGRLSEGRKWREGVHQAVEAKEGVEITVDTGQAARITVQDFFLRYEHLAGMTGTAASSARELKRIYRCNFMAVPTNKPPQRVKLPTRIYGYESAKWDAIAEEIAEVHATGRPILVGTRSIDKSETLSQRLKDRGIEHQVLNANQIAEEAEIVAQAGQKGKVTVSTNMAGRGTDIRLGEGVEELGGLYVICTEMHDSARIDRQLIGRCGRQGDPGAYRQYLALDDELLLNGLGKNRAKRIAAKGIALETLEDEFQEAQKLTAEHTSEISPDIPSDAAQKLAAQAHDEQKIRESKATRFDKYEYLFIKAQKKVERKHYKQRKALMYFEKQRKKMQRQMGQDPYLDTTN